MSNRHACRLLAATAAGLLALAGSACSAGAGAAGTDPERVDVTAAFYPLQYVTERVGGDSARVTGLTQPGVEAHDLELTPRQVGAVSDAELIVYLKGFQPAVDEAVEQSGGDRAFDVATVQPLLGAAAGGHAHEDTAGDHPGEEGDHEGEDGDHEDAETGGKDPHVWLDPTRLATIADRLADRLAEIDPDRAAGYTERATALRAELEKLDQEYADGLRDCQRREIVVSHTAFGYLAERYRLEQIGVSGLTPENEPAPQRLIEVAEEAREHGATTIFFETLVSPKVADTIAREVGAKTAVLDPLEGLSPGAPGDYLSIMRANLATLRTALGCA